MAATPHFAFFSDFATNLNDALIVAGTARNDGRAELFSDDSEAAGCFAELPASLRTGWNLAVDFSAQVIAPTSWMGRQQYLIRADLAAFDEDFDDGARRFMKTSEGVRMAAAGAYEACGWPAQDADNRRFLETLKPRLSAHEAAIKEKLVHLYGTSWRGLPIRVDIVSTALPVGANTFHTPPHIMISSAIEDRDALEIVHHEASHTLMGRNDPMQKALTEAAEKLHVELPTDLWHIVLFYTTGETVRRVLAEAGEPGYTPYMEHHDLWSGRWGRSRDAVENAWTAYLDGRRSLSDAAADLVRALPAE